jgi:hypothetical protein
MRRLVIFLAVCGLLGAVQAAAAIPALASTAVPPVTHVSAKALSSSAVRLSWRWPSASSVVSVTIRMAKGSAAPKSPSGGQAAGKASRPGHTVTVRRLKARTRYAFAVFARNSRGKYAKAATVRATTRPRPLKVATASLANGVKGMAYLQVLSASGGVPPYKWSATGLPTGLRLSSAGVISGYPRSARTRTVTLLVRDARRVAERRKLKLRIPSSLPSGCIARSCAKVSKDGHTVQVPATDITAVTRDARTGKVTKVGLSGIKVAKGDVLVLAAASGIPSGLIAVVKSVTAGKQSGSLTAGVATATPADAYHRGIVQAIGKPPAAAGRRGLARSAPVRSETDLHCGGKVTSAVRGLTVTPSLTPTVAAEWAHPDYGGKGLYHGAGGLSLFQFGLTGTITVNLGVSVSGKATCELDLPGIERGIYVEPVGWVVFQLDPSLTLKTTAQVDVRTSVTLSCDTELVWDHGKSTRSDYCGESHQPLELGVGSGVDATLTGAIDTSLTLDDLPGVTGNVEAVLHAGYHPERHPIAEIDAKSDWDIKAVLFNIWKSGPSLTIAKGTFFNKTLATYDTPPPPPVTTRTATQAPLPAGAATQQAYASLVAVACPDVSSCTAVGSYTDSADFLQGLLETGAETRWTPAKAPLPKGADSDSNLTAVACPAATSCVALGDYDDSSGNTQGLLLTGSGAAWKAAKAPLPSGAPSSQYVSLNSVACPSASSCTAVGSYSSAKGQSGLILTRSGSSWKAVSAPLPAHANPAPEASLTAVTCPSSSSCTAVGTYTDASGIQQGLLLTGSGKSWTAAQAPLPRGATTNLVFLDAVACPAAFSCVVGGWYRDAATSYNQGLVLAESGRSWTATLAPLPDPGSDNPNAVLNAVACPAVSSCVAAGEYQDVTGVHYQGLLLTGSGMSWTPTQPLLPVGASQDSHVQISALACPAASSCFAAGSYYASGTGFQGLLLTGAGTSWTPAQAPLPPAAAASDPEVSLYSVACPSPAACTAVGTFSDTDGNGQGLLIASPG